ncbi:hypothetical protein [Mycobacterium deserti]|uniref:Uncharacterized protein n=1 Tax=Mycobacterium deserti TaxID=2978347 RepID=A0ABT2M638_9MYCO|nr:hypothetical protein [Mycobacterium deserti]MCT7657728.1 hypothetical protein [Mycobacterium deserti]
MVPATPRRGRSLAERAAAEAFAYVMHRCRVRQHELAAEAWIQATGRPVAGGTSREVVRRYRVAPPFWAVTVEIDEPVPTGYGVNAHAVVIRYAQRDIPLSTEADGFTSVRTEFGPGCRDLLGRASTAFPAFLCETVPPAQAQEVAGTYLIDAALSQAEGRGPLLTTSASATPQRGAAVSFLECSSAWRPSSPRSSTGRSPAGSSTKTTTSSLS